METGMEKQLDSQAIISQATHLGERETDYIPATQKPEELDEKIAQMLSVNKPVIFDCLVDKVENCYPMIPSGKPHNQMLLGDQDEEEEISEEGKVLV